MRGREVKVSAIDGEWVCEKCLKLGWVGKGGRRERDAGKVRLGDVYM